MHELEKMSTQHPPKIGYILKRYPRYSETFIVNEILAHEAAGLAINIFALRPPCDTHFQNIIAQVRAPVTYIHKPTQGRLSNSLKTQNPTAASYFWAELEEASQTLPNFWSKLEFAQGERASVVYQAAWVAREARKRGITHLHAHFGSVATSVARVASHFANIPYTFTAHAKDIFHDSVEPEDMRRKLREAAAVVTVSDYNLNYLQQTYGKDADKIHRIYNGLNLQQLTYCPPQNRPPLIISVGRLVEKKGLSILIHACAFLKAWGLNFHCQIIGTGPLETELQTQIQRLRLDSVVEIIGPRPQNEVFEIVQQAAVFVAPYIIAEDGNRDGLPTVLLEAMALGTPCIATDVTGIPELIKHQDTGLLVPQHNSEALALAVQTLLKDPNLGLQLATQARKTIESAFDIHANAASLRKLFQPQSNPNTKSELPSPFSHFVETLYATSLHKHSVNKNY